VPGGRHFEQIVTRLDEQSRASKMLSVIREVTDRTDPGPQRVHRAARAGGQAGFAVVAGGSVALEVPRRRRTSAAIVKTIRSHIREAVNAIHSGVKKVEEGKSLIFKSGEAMGETLEAAQKTAQMTAVVEKATVEQAEGLQQIRVAVENARLMLEQVAKSTEEERRSADSMLESIVEVKEVAELVRKGTGEHAAGTEVISRNLEESRDRVTRIHQAALDQLKANEAIVDAVEKIKRSE
jgi:methyl-accepting chemotaxis protein